MNNPSGAPQEQSNLSESARAILPDLRAINTKLNEPREGLDGKSLTQLAAEMGKRELNPNESIALATEIFEVKSEILAEASKSGAGALTMNTVENFFSKLYQNLKIDKYINGEGEQNAVA